MTDVRKKILVPVDFEGASERALSTARWLAGPLGADLVLVHVHHRAGFDHPELGDEMIARVQAGLDSSAQKRLAELAAAHGVSETLYRHGEPAEGILEAAREIAPAMVVMGTHGRGGLNRLFIGSVAARVMRDCPVPLVTVRATAD
jgi:nucleotide-binding universal stress UspA family protein